jgi:serine/threonine protein kinase
MPQSIVQPLRRWDPERIGSFTIIGRLGAGAMGQVFLARSPAGRLVAVKTIRVELAEEAGFRARFAREVAAASRVSGVFTAPVIEADPDADLPWVATAYVPAPSLSVLVKKAGPLPVPAVRWLAAGCAEALASIHAAGLLHRDVKPSNILIAPDGPRVIDFGVARASERVTLTSTRGAAGTPAYMAPEQARDATLASPASDVFSLGATLVFAATGHAPYQGETVMDIFVRLATEPPDLDGLPGELEALVTACLERTPRNRPSDATIIDTLGPFARSGAGHVHLPDSAMAVIADYLVVAEFQHRPRLAAELADGEDPASDDYSARDSVGSATDDSAVSLVTDVTDGSHTALPGFEEPGSLQPLGPASLGEPSRPGLDGSPAPSGAPVRVSRKAARRAPLSRRPQLLAAAWLTERALLPFWARLLMVALFIAAGIAIGLALRLGNPPASANSPYATTSSTADIAGLGPVLHPPRTCTPHEPGTTPELCVSQPTGDGDTTFVIHGSGFQPFMQITVQIVNVGPSPDRPITDLRGSFSYVVDQGHRFFHGLIPPGTYQVVATASNGDTARASFRVNQIPSAPPPSTSPSVSSSPSLPLSGSESPSGSPPPDGTPPPDGYPPSSQTTSV